MRPIASPDLIRSTIQPVAYFVTATQLPSNAGRDEGLLESFRQMHGGTRELPRTSLYRAIEDVPEMNAVRADVSPMNR